MSRRLAAMTLALACVAAPLAAAGCVSAPPADTSTQVHVLATRAGRDRPSTFYGLPLATGQIVLSEAPGPYSVLFALGPARFFRFTHAALLVFEDGEPWVYDFSGAYKPGFDARPSDAIEGGMRRQRFLDYCAANLYCEVIDPPPGADVERLVDYVHDVQTRDVPFDAYFRFDDGQERLYCSEFVEVGLRTAGAKPSPFIPVRTNPSLRAFLVWNKLPLDLSLPAGGFHDPERSVGAVGQLRSLTAVACYFAAKKEIHRRFTDDQLLGNVFLKSGQADIDLRPEVFAFMEHAVHLFDGARFAPDEAAVDDAVRALADRLFGPLA